MRIQLSLFIFIIFMFVSCKKEPINSKVLSTQGLAVEDKVALKYADSLYLELLNKPNDSLNREKLLEIASEYENRRVYSKSKETSHEVFKRASIKKDTLHKAKALWYLGDVYDSEEKLDSAFMYYTKAEKWYALSKKDSLNWARMISYKAGVLYETGIQTESEVEAIRALDMLQRLKATRLIYETTVAMALNLGDMEEYNEALKYFNKVPHLLHQLEEEGYKPDKVKRSWLSYYNNLANFHNKTKEYAKAKPYAEKALKSKNVQDFPEVHALLLNNLAIAYMYTSGNNNRIIDSLLNTALEIRNKIDHKQGIIASKITIAEYLLMKKDTVNALMNMQEAYCLSINHKKNSDILICLDFLAKNHIKNKEHYAQKYHQVKDSLYQLEKATRNKFARIAYETDEVAAQNTLLLKRSWYYAIGGVIFFLVGVGLFFIYRLQLKNKKLAYHRKELSNIQKIQELLLEQQLVAEHVRNDERDRIAKDLHDAVVNRIFTTRLNLEKANMLDKNQQEKLISELKKSEQQIREISHDIHSSLFHQKQSFSHVLEDLVNTQKNNFETKFSCSIDLQIDWNVLSIQQKTQVYLILQELLQNVNKHAQASVCHVFFIQSTNNLVIRVHDDGVGFNQQKITTGIGLKSIQVRAKKLNAIVTTKSQNNLTITEINIPIVMVNNSF